MSNEAIISLLTNILIVLICILSVLSIIFVILSLRKKISNKPKKVKIDSKESKGTNKSKAAKPSMSYSKQSIYSFMEFDKIEDNMIVQRKGRRYLMAIQCQGINYDLMSGLEKNSVEQGFLQFLNTLRHPIQIYIQTKTVNLTNSIDTYKDRIKDIYEDLVKKQVEYNQKVRSENYTQAQLAKDRFEVIKKQNLYEYGIDIIKNTEGMSLNSNILTRTYYIIIPYYPDELGNSDFDQEEIKNIAFSELYTKAQTIISALSVCGVNGKILDSNGLTELLYVAYNRDDSEIYDLDRALKARFDDLYSTAPDVLDKRMIEIDKKIEEDAIRRANEAIFDAVEESEKEKSVKQKEAEMKNIIEKLAKEMIEENKKVLGQELTQKAKKRVTQITEEKGGKENEKGQKTRIRGIGKSTI